MSTKQIVTCDMCGVTRGETNHWWLVWASIKPRIFNVSPYVEDSDHGLDVCGEQCVTKFLQRFLATGSLEEKGKA